jgi:hypothetical protein
MPNFSVLYTNSGNRFKASEIRLTDENPVRWPTGSFHFFYPENLQGPKQSAKVRRYWMTRNKAFPNFCFKTVTLNRQSA